MPKTIRRPARALLNRRNGSRKRDNRQSIGVIGRRGFVTITCGEREGTHASRITSRRRHVCECRPVSQGRGSLISSLLSPTD